MARRPRIEVDGGLYHLITRGNARQDIFHSAADHEKFISLLEKQKARYSFYIYAYCLMTNHVHLLIERRSDAISIIMQRLLSSYSQYYNRKYKRVGHLFQGRYKSILCQSEGYLAKLVRYIHLNPVRAGMVDSAAEYPYSSQRDYFEHDSDSLVDVDPVLRLFGNTRQTAREHFALFMGEPDDDAALYSTAENDVLGSEEFVDTQIHRLGGRLRRPSELKKSAPPAVDVDILVASVAGAMNIDLSEFHGNRKGTRAVTARELTVLISKERGASLLELSETLGIDTSNISRSYDRAKRELASNAQFRYAKTLVEREYEKRKTSQA